MKTTLFHILSVVIVCAGIISCGDKNDLYEIPDEKNPPRKVYNEIKIHISKTELKLFEGTVIGIGFTELNRLAVEEAPVYQYLSYDSIVWNIPKVFKNVSKDGRNLISFTQSFYLPGKYDISISGYKEGKVISADTTKITVGDGGDFLGLNWNNLTAYEPFNFIKSTPSNDPQFVIHLYTRNNPVVYTLLRQSSMKGFQDEESQLFFYKNLKQILFDYITNLYGKSVFNYVGNDISKSDLIAEYNKRFTIPLNKIETNWTYVPVTIWETPTTNISLVGSVESEFKINYLKIIAQPRNK